MEGNEEKLEEFLNWASNLGVTDCPLSLQSSTSSPFERANSFSCLGRSVSVSNFPDAGGRGLAAARELRRGELILRVPKYALLTTENVLEDQILAATLSKYPYLSSIQALAVCLLSEVGKGKGSRWHPYFVQLPCTYETLENFNRFEIQALQVDDATWASEKAISKARSDWKGALPLLQEIHLRPRLLTFRSWLWASTTISSRTLHIPWDDAGCLCPVGDFFNYAAPEETSFLSEDTRTTDGVSNNFFTSGGSNITDKSYSEQLEGNSHRLTDGGYEEAVSAYCFYARKSYKPGEQVLLCYGSYTNLELMEHYGFLLDSNPGDKAFIQLGEDIHMSHSQPIDSLYIQPDGRPSFALSCALRLWAMTPNLRREVGHLAYSGHVLSIENEAFVLNWLSQKCLSILQTLPTSAEVDTSLLDVIDRLQSQCSPEMPGQMLNVEGELNDFLEANGLAKGDVAGFQMCNKAVRSMRRWELAVKWRLRYKRTLLDCISYCSEMTSHLSSSNA